MDGKRVRSSSTREVITRSRNHWRYELRIPETRKMWHPVSKIGPNQLSISQYDEQHLYKFLTEMKLAQCNPVVEGIIYEWGMKIVGEPSQTPCRWMFCRLVEIGLGGSTYTRQLKDGKTERRTSINHRRREAHIIQHECLKRNWRVIVCLQFPAEQFRSTNSETRLAWTCIGVRSGGPNHSNPAEPYAVSPGLGRHLRWHL